MPLNPVKSEELFFELKLSYHSHLEKSKKAQGFKEGIPRKKKSKNLLLNIFREKFLCLPSSSSKLYYPFPEIFPEALEIYQASRLAGKKFE